MLIVPHRYAAEHRHKQATSGVYNVEWLTFRRDPDGLAALNWWHDRCIEWCYARYEDGKMGDQKYLDDWPTRFERVHVLENPGGGLAPWNVTNHELAELNGRPCVDGRPLIFYHHHSLRLYRPSGASRLAAAVGQLRRGVPPVPLYWTTNYPVTAVERRLVWEPYLRELGDAFRMIAPRPGIETYRVSQLTRKGLRLGRRVAGRLKRAVDPARRLPGAATRYRESWRSNEVAQQMLELTDQQLQDPEIVAPYVAFRDLLAPLVAGTELPRPARILDIGAGAGAYGELLDRWWPGRFEYVGADYSEEILAVAREAMAKTHLRADRCAPADSARRLRRRPRERLARRAGRDRSGAGCPPQRRRPVGGAPSTAHRSQPLARRGGAGLPRAAHIPLLCDA